MSPVKRFVLRASAFAGLQLVVLGALLAVRPEVRPIGYFAATIDKHDRLAATPPPRLILVGGSSVAFGHDSPAIARALGLSPVNMGLQANLPTRFMLAEVEEALGPGDVVLVALEYQRLAAPGGHGPELDAVLRARPASVRFWHEEEHPLDRGFEALRAAIGRRPVDLEQLEPPGPPPYGREYFNEAGDVVAHRTMQRPPLDLARIPGFTLADYRPSACAAVLDLLDRFDERARARGARAFLVYPPQPRSLFERTAPAIRLLAAQVRRELAMPVLLEPEEAVQPDDQFFDTEYHLNGAGVAARTRLLTVALLARR